MVYEDLYCARGTCENMMKAAKCDLHSDRTSATTFLANAMRTLLACAAYILHHTLRTQTLRHTALAHAQPSTVILTLFKVATLVQTVQPWIHLHLPRRYPVKRLLHPVTALLYAVPVLVGQHILIPPRLPASMDGFPSQEMEDWPRRHRLRGQGVFVVEPLLGCRAPQFQEPSQLCPQR